MWVVFDEESDFSDPRLVILSSRRSFLGKAPLYQAENFPYHSLLIPLKGPITAPLRKFRDINEVHEAKVREQDSPGLTACAPVRQRGPGTTFTAQVRIDRIDSLC